MADGSNQRPGVVVPGFVVSAIVCLMLSVGATVIVMLSLGYKRGESVYDQMKQAKEKQGGPGSASPAGTMPKAFGPDEAAKAKMSQGLGDPRPAQQVVTLIAKLDELTAEAGKLELTAEQQAKVRDQLQALTVPDYLADSVAREHMDAILKVLENHRQTLEAAGFKWPGGTYNPNMRPGPNPFKEGEPAKHLKALLDRFQSKQ
jgi:hypothetical protein